MSDIVIELKYDKFWDKPNQPKLNGRVRCVDVISPIKFNVCKYIK